MTQCPQLHSIPIPGSPEGNVPSLGLVTDHGGCGQLMPTEPHCTTASRSPGKAEPLRSVPSLSFGTGTLKGACTLCSEPIHACRWHETLGPPRGLLTRLFTVPFLEQRRFPSLRSRTRTNGSPLQSLPRHPMCRGALGSLQRLLGGCGLFTDDVCAPPDGGHPEGRGRLRHFDSQQVTSALAGNSI